MALAARVGFMPGSRPGLLSLSLHPSAVNRGIGCANPFGDGHMFVAGLDVPPDPGSAR
jgi:hypothetical protein